VLQRAFDAPRIENKKTLMTYRHLLINRNAAKIGNFCVNVIHAWLVGIPLNFAKVIHATLVGIIANITGPVSGLRQKSHSL